jgi:hypothetical protein
MERHKGNAKGVDDMRTRGVLAIIATICGLLFMGPLASGQASEFPAPPYLTSPWKFDLAPYLWVPAMTGDVTVRGRTADVDVGLGDTLDLIFDDLQFAFMGRFEARKGNLLFTLDVDYTDLEDDNTTARGLDADVTSKSWIVEVRGRLSPGHVAPEPVRLTGLVF